ncbi:MAG: tRNA-dihydrouridine synthase [Pirellulales bacterium]|nr:tRNA-dihydrouridine synthase [Pirellulales bacterium]
MRAVARRLGAGYTVGEVVLDRFVVESSRGGKGEKLLRIGDDEHPCGVQLMGSRSEDFPPAALHLVELGYDVIDLNFACPVRKVLGRQRGGFLLGQPDTALEIITRVRETLPPHVPVTIKLRRGLDDTTASLDAFYTILDGAMARGVAAVTVHGRTVEQRYHGPTSWEFLAEVKGHLGDRIVLGSGDLFTPRICARMLCETGVDGLSIARGAIGNPWIFQQTLALLEDRPLPPPPSTHEQRDVIAEHYRRCEAIFGPSRAGRRMRKFGIRYAELHPCPEEVRAAFIAVRGPADWQAVLACWYADDRPGRYPRSTFVGK